MIYLKSRHGMYIMFSLFDCVYLNIEVGTYNQGELSTTCVCLSREKGGAYGSGAQLNDGTFSFFSYRFDTPTFYMTIKTMHYIRSCI